nr:hypothetical protein [Desulfobulbaceae bacterium]
MESVHQISRPILLANFANSLFFDDDFRVIEELKMQFGGELEIYVASTSDREQYAQKFDIGGYPIFILFCNSEEIARFHGSATRKDLGDFCMRFTGKNR